MNMELESLLSFKQTYFEPRCVLILTIDKKIQMKRLFEQNCSESESEVAINRTEMYANYNQEHPGFFDAVISSNDLDSGYENLKNLVLNYLGVSNLEIKDTSDYSNFNQHQLSTVQSSRLKKSDEMREQINEMRRTGCLF